MDKPGPGRQAAERPLIIERPELAHPVRRALALVITAVAWCAWILLWLPVIDYAAGGLGLDQFWRTRSGALSAQALRDLVSVFPLAMGLLLAALALNGAIGWLYRRLHAPAAHAAVDTHALAAGMALDEERLARWQAARVIRVEHNEQGRVVDAQVLR